MKRHFPFVLALLCLSAGIAGQSQTPRPMSETVADLEKRAAEVEQLIAELRAALPKPPDKPTDPPPPPNVIHVPGGGNLAAAIASAPTCATITLEPGRVYTGNYVFRKCVTLTVQGPFPIADGTRITPADKALLPQLVTGNAGNLIDIVPGVDSKDITLRRLYLGPANANAIVRCGGGDAASGQTTLDVVPQNIVFDQLLVEGDPTIGSKRGIELNCGKAEVTNSTVRDIWREGQETAGIGGWNGPGPHLIKNNAVEAMSQSVFYGGSDPAIPGLIPSDITIEDNLFTKDPIWKVKNLGTKNFVEFKTGRRIVVQRNRMGPQWASAQSYAIVITPSQYGTNPGVTVQDVKILDNEILSVPGGFNILGHGQNQTTRPTEISERITISRNRILIDVKAAGGSGWMMMLGNGPKDVVFTDNTVLTNSGGHFIQGNSNGNATAGPTGFRFTGNIIANIGKYGTFLSVAAPTAGSGMCVSGVTCTNLPLGARWRDYFPGGVIEGNAFLGDQSVFRSNFPNNLHLPTCLEKDAAGVCIRPTSSLVVDFKGTGQLEPYGWKQ